jgi:hypothetical protein
MPPPCTGLQGTCVEAESEEIGHGLSFTLTLPINEAGCTASNTGTEAALKSRSFSLSHLMRGIKPGLHLW